MKRGVWLFVLLFAVRAQGACPTAVSVRYPSDFSIECKSAGALLLVLRRSATAALTVDALDPATLAPRWQAPVGHGENAWQLGAGDVSTLAFYRSSLSGAWSVEAHDTHDGRVRWRHEDATAFGLQQLVACGNVFVGADILNLPWRAPDDHTYVPARRRLVALASRSGDVAWTKERTDKEYTYDAAAFACAGGRIVQALDHDGLHILDATNGTESAHIALPDLKLLYVAPSKPVAAQGSTFVWVEATSDLGWRVVTFDVDRRRIVWTRPGATKIKSITVDDGMVHVTSDDEQAWRVGDGAELPRGATVHVVVEGRMTRDGSPEEHREIALGRVTAVTGADGHYRVEADITQPEALRWSFACASGQAPVSQPAPGQDAVVPRTAGAYRVDIVGRCLWP